MTVDQYGQETTGSSKTIEDWSNQLTDLLMMRGDPIVELDAINESDDSFVMGAVLNGSARVIGGLVPTGPEIQQDLSRARSRLVNANKRETRHVAALEKLVSGDFPGACGDWAAIVRDYPSDLAATRIAHDLCVHYGDAELRMVVADYSMQAWSPGDNGYGVAMGMYSFALEETGRFDEAEDAALRALEANYDDAWALHSLSHTYEHLDAQEKSVSMMENNMEWWTNSTLLSNHLWWHLAVRLIENQEYDRCLGIADSQMSGVDTGFGLADLSSLLWRLELAGCDVGDRWDMARDLWSKVACIHTSAFLDMHASMALSTEASSPLSSDFLAGVETPYYEGSFNGAVMTDVSPPLVEAIFKFRSGAYSESASLIAGVGSNVQEIGGSNAQREILVRTQAMALERQDPQSALAFLGGLHQSTPGRVWVNQAIERITAAS